MDGLAQPKPAAPRASRPAVTARRRGGDVRVALQFIGERLVVARARRDGADLAIESLRSLPAPAAGRAALLRALKQEGLFRNARVHVLLAPGQYDIHQANAPAVAAEEMRDALRWQLRAALGYPAEEALIDFAVLPQPADAPSTRLIAVTARRAAVAELVAPLAACGVSVDAVDVPEFAQRNLAQACSPAEEGTQAWLAFDEDTFLLTVHCLGEVAFARRMLLPNAALSPEADADPVAHFVERVALQVQRSLDLFERQSGLPPIAAIAVGPHAQATAVAAEIGEKAAVRTWLAETAPVLQRAAAAGGSGGLAAELTAALGAALPPAAGDAAPVQSIDLYRAERAARRRATSWRPLAAALAATAVGLGIHLWIDARSLATDRDTAARLRADVQRTERMLVALNAPVSARAGEADVAALEALAARLDEAPRLRSEPFTEPLRALARARIDGVWLTGLRLDNSGGELVLEGKALDAARLPQWLAALQREPRFAGTAFARIEVQPAREPAGALQFRLATAVATAPTGSR